MGTATKAAGSAAGALLFEGFPEGELLDRDRAAFIMARYNLDALVLSHPTNVYQVTGYPSNNLIYQNVYRDSGAIAVIARDLHVPPALVIPSFSFYYHFAEPENGADDLQVYLVTDTSDVTSVISSDKPIIAGGLVLFEDRGHEPVDTIEKTRVGKVTRHAALRPPSTSIRSALAAALRERGLIEARLGVDAPAAESNVESIAPKAIVSDAKEVMAAYRIVKSGVEIALMRRAARINAEASLAAIRCVVRAGGNYQDLRAAFFSECCLRGNIPQAMIIDRVKRESFNADFHDGQAFLIDAVSHSLGYFGDYGRTIFIGEPAKAMRRATDAIGFASDIIHQSMKPGMRFSDIRRVGLEALKRGGYDTGVRFGPHSLGLGHGDVADLAEADIVLEPGMIISIDCPVMDSGIGGSAHLEDSIVVTTTGTEPINDLRDQVVTV